LDVYESQLLARPNAIRDAHWTYIKARDKAWAVYDRACAEDIITALGLTRKAS
jgi:hypothetical protein